MTRQPNVYLLSADALRADRARDMTERVAERTAGTRFTDAVAPACHTASAVPALSTGQFVDGSGPGDGTHLLSAFAAEGYRTRLVTDNPLAAASVGEASGPEEAGGLTNALDDLLPRKLTRGVERAYFRRVWPTARRLGLADPYYRPASELNDSALDTVSGEGRPTFCWVHYMDTHSPYRVSSGTDALGDRDQYRVAAKSRSVALGRPSAADADDVVSASRLYRAACDELGETVVEFVDRLLERGVYDPNRDVLAVTADHGDCLDPDRDLLGHVPPASWESLVHVPLVVARPDWPEETVTDQVSLVDLPGMLRPAVGQAPDPTAFGREYAVTVAGTLGDAGTVRGVRHAAGEKLFGRRTATGTDVVQTRYEVGDPAAETVVERWTGETAVVDAPDGLLARAADAGGLVEGASYLPAFDESHLRDLGYLE